MSFLSAVGSGPKEAYAEIAVEHIRSGKAISRAIREHILVYVVLHAI